MIEGFQKLEYFTNLIWVDQNPQIQEELKKFIFAFGPKIHFFESPGQALQLIHTAEQQKFLIISSSKIIEQIQVNFTPCFNCYPKYIFFCGSFGRCQFITKKYPEIVYKAEYFQDKIFSAIFQLQKNLLILTKSSLINPIWVVPKANDKHDVRKHEGQFLKMMQYLQYIPVKILDKKQINKKQHYPNNKIIVYILDNRDNIWEQNFMEVYKQKNQNNQIKNIFMIVDQGQKKKDCQQFREFLTECVKVTSTQELSKQILNFIRQLTTI